MSSAPDRSLRRVWLACAAAAFGACWPTAAAWAGATVRPRQENALVICHDHRVEIIVGGIAERDAHPCGGIGNDTERAASRPRPADTRIAPATQRARDDDRRAILQQELDRAEGELVQERSRPAGDPGALLRKQEDVAALRRELQGTPAVAR